MVLALGHLILKEGDVGDNPRAMRYSYAMPVPWNPDMGVSVTRSST